MIPHILLTLLLISSVEAQVGLNDITIYNDGKTVDFDIKQKNDEVYIGNYLTYPTDIITPVYETKYYYKGLEISQDLVDAFFDGNLIVDKDTLEEIELVQTDIFSHYEYDMTLETVFSVDFICDLGYITKKKEWTIEELAIEKISERRCR